MSEIWLPVPGFSDYRVSNHGRVYNSRLDRYIKPIRNKKGYLVVKLYREGQAFQKYVARIVAEMYLEDWRPNIQVGFKDRDPSNCRASNLIIRGDRLRYYREQPIRQTGRRVRIRETNQVFRSVHTAARAINGDPRAMYRVLRGHQHTHLGYTFEWLNTKQSLEFARKGQLQ